MQGRASRYAASAKVTKADGAKLILSQNNGTLLATAIPCRIVDRRPIPLPLRCTKNQRAALDLFRQPFELCLAINVGGRFEIEPPHAHQSISNVDADARVVNRRAFNIGNRESD